MIRRRYSRCNPLFLKPNAMVSCRLSLESLHWNYLSQPLVTAFESAHRRLTKNIPALRPRSFRAFAAVPNGWGKVTAGSWEYLYPIKTPRGRHFSGVVSRFFRFLPFLLQHLQMIFWREVRPRTRGEITAKSVVFDQAYVCGWCW